MCRRISTNPIDFQELAEIREAIAGAELVAGGVPPRAIAEPLDLGLRHEAAVARVTRRPQLARAIPAPQRVGADAERLGGLAEGQVGHRGAWPADAPKRSPPVRWGPPAVSARCP